MGPKSRSGGVGSSGDRLCQTSPIPRSPDGDNNFNEKMNVGFQKMQREPLAHDRSVSRSVCNCICISVLQKPLISLYCKSP